MAAALVLAQDCQILSTCCFSLVIQPLAALGDESAGRRVLGIGLLQAPLHRYQAWTWLLAPQSSTGYYDRGSSNDVSHVTCSGSSVKSGFCSLKIRIDVV